MLWWSLSVHTHARQTEHQHTCPNDKFATIAVRRERREEHKKQFHKKENEEAFLTRRNE